MWSYEKRLQYPVNITTTNPKLAMVIMSQLGGPDGEIGASLRYLNQRYSMPDRQVAGILTDVGTEELAHMEMVAAILYQLTRNVPEEKIRKVVIAYEPIWAIGTGMTATPEQAQEVCEDIRTVVRKLYTSKHARAISILYGGSMNEKNAYELLAQPDIDGGLIGGASLVPEKFVQIIEAANQPTV